MISKHISHKKLKGTEAYSLMQETTVKDNNGTLLHRLVLYLFSVYSRSVVYMRQSMMLTICLTIVFSMVLVSIVTPVYAAVRIKDIAHFQGVRDNQLIGYGLVVGLNGTGDKSSSIFTVKSIASLLSRMGIDVKSSQISPKNVAAVMVTATLPPFIKPGARIDVTLSSLGDATSLAGGTLLLTPLQGIDAKVYAAAQGQVSIGGMEAGGRSNSFATVARVPQGALIENEVPVTLVEENRVMLSLVNVDFTTCIRMTEAVNVEFNQPIARAHDGATVEIEVPNIYAKNIVGFLARIEHLEIQPDNRAKIVINERTGTIVGGRDAKISRVTVNHKNISIDIVPPEKTKENNAKKSKRIENQLSAQPAMFTEDVEVVEESVGQEETTIGDVAQLLNSMGVKPPDMIAIFQAIKEAGAIQAEIDII